MSAMIVALEPKEFIPCGQTACVNHPGVICLHFNQSQEVGTSLLGTLSQVTLDDKPKGTDSWKLRVYKNVEEELYLSGHTVVWSRGQTVLKTFTVDSLVKQVAWGSFSVSGEDPCQFDLPQSKPGTYPSVDGVAMVTDDAVHVFTDDGDNFVTALPFKVRDSWNFKFGLLFERKREMMEKNKANMSSFQTSLLENDLTTIFCLQHPLREFSPVITKTQGSVRYMNRPHDSIVFCEEDFILTCDKRHGLHTVWRARAVSANDINLLQSSRVPTQNQMGSVCHMSMSSPGLSPFRGSFRGSPGYHGNSHGGIPQSGMNKTPHTNRNPSLAHLSYTPHSSRAFSPSATGSLMYQNHTFSPLRHSPHLTRSPCTPVSHESLCLNNSVYETAEPLQPEICLDHMWTETVTCTREGLSVGCATKVFLIRDVCDQSYLAYHLDSQSQLRVVRYSHSNNLTHLIFGAVESIQARDAAPLKDLRMHAVLDLSGSLVLYTGITKVVKVNLSGLPMSSLGLSHGLRNTASVPATPQPISTPAHPSRPTSAMATMEDVGMLSPVPELDYTGNDISILTGDEFAFSTSGFSSRLVGLPHVVGSTLILEVAGGNNYRAEVPQLCSSELVNMCMRALQFVLPNDTYLSYVTKWYTFRHAPGALNGRHVEWSLFVDCLQEFLGYVGMSRWQMRQSAIQDSMEFDVSSSPVVAAKKSRHSDLLDPKVLKI
nr:anaphase-promoting complex subunit 1-like [Ciona intestinalis]|eukprot:XP_002122497.2 anaphase-promoting complex subunit 1-like [Ciona intestinalis]